MWRAFLPRKFICGGIRVGRFLVWWGETLIFPYIQIYICIYIYIYIYFASVHIYICIYISVCKIYLENKNHHIIVINIKYYYQQQTTLKPKKINKTCNEFFIFRLKESSPIQYIPLNPNPGGGRAGL